MPRFLLRAVVSVRQWLIRRLRKHELKDPTFGSQYIWITMDADTKLVIPHQIGKRELHMAFGLIVDLKERVQGRPTIITDGLVHNFDAVHHTYGRFCVDFAKLVKVVMEGKPKAVREGYSPAKVVTCTPYPIYGNPDPARISTSYIERQNLTVRMSVRRFARLTNAFSKKLENLKAATALQFACYNFCRIHGSLRTTPAMAAGITGSIWEIEDLLPQMKSWSFRQFISVLHQHGFALKNEKGAIRTYEGVVNGERRLVTIHYHHGSDDIKPGTLASLIRQSGLSKKLFC